MDQSFKELLEASSLGTPAARRIRSSTSTEVVDDVRRRMEHHREPSLTHAMASAPATVQSILAGDTFRQRAERRALLISASSRLKDRVRHPDGGVRSVEEVLQAEAAQRAQIDQETARASRKHHRLLRWMRWIPKCVLVFDFLLLLYFFAGIADVNWASPLSVQLALAIGLAAIVTLLSYGFLAFTGHRLRSHKNHAGTIHLEDLDGFTRAAFGIAFVGIAALAMLMFVRMRAEVLDALETQASITALVIATAVAVVSAVANSFITAVHALDGSDETAWLDKLSAVSRRSLNRAHRGVSGRSGRQKPRRTSLLRRALWLTGAVGVLAVPTVIFSTHQPAQVAYLILAAFFGGFSLGVVAMVAVAIRKEDRLFSLSGAAPGAAARGVRRLSRFGGSQARISSHAAGPNDE